MNTTPVQDFLAEMARTSAERVKAARAHVSEADLYRRALDTAAPPRAMLSKSGFDLIAEVKLRAPSAGDLQTGDNDVAARVLSYARGGAVAVSILTEPIRFSGALEHLEAGAAALRGTGVPVMRKDFLVDAYQLMEARVLGAGGALLIVRMLSDERLSELLECAREIGLFVLLEAFDEQDLDRAGAALAHRDPRTDTIWVGLNTRDLKTLEVDSSRLARLVHAFPPGWRRVAESGIVAKADVQQAAGLGYHVALVGTALMRTGQPRRLVQDFLKAGREAVPSPDSE